MAILNEENKKEAVDFVKDEIKDTVKDEVSEAVTDVVSDAAGDVVGDVIPFGGGIFRVITWPIRALFKKKK